MLPSAFEELLRRRRWEQEILRDALRGNLRVEPDSPWLPGEAVLEEARELLKAGGCEAERRRIELDPKRLLGAVEVVPRRGDRIREASEQAQEQGADAVLAATDWFTLRGGPAHVRAARDRFEGPVFARGYAVDEADVAVAAALEADGLIASAAVADELLVLRRAAHCYALPLWAEVQDRAELDAAIAADVDGIILCSMDEEPARARDRSLVLLSGMPPLPTLVAGGRSLRAALALRRAGADGLLVPPPLLELELAELQDADEPAFEADDALLAALGQMGVADPLAFTQSGTGLLLLPSEPFAAPAPVDEPPPSSPLDVLRVRRPRGPRV